MTQSRRTLTERRADELRLAIAEVAFDMFVADGNTSATVERISQAVGIAPRTFYRHFEVKEDVVRPIFTKSSDVIVDALASTGEDVALLEGLVAAFLSQMDGTALTPEARTFLGLMLTTPAYKIRWLDVDPPLRQAVADLLDRRLGLSADPYIHLLAADLIVHAARDAFQHWVSSQEREPTEALLRRSFTLILKGLEHVIPRT
ncbi:probable transcriptional regulator, TetR family protein (plasmid) [Rhodococcus jostii RHA1]|uniref:Probable transcriptional regulator, TetR family protein n=1 Tax=Rhodococcus jostii (strain RHA1) TaxID=101510 RepID=Q0RXE5_RHOJR|nr:TetR/AcrR family transcriptional regulator [Rhodococcus jostii]ABH00041.1 probable transcriptional regulator, TetR family protein [Rhodococcus jostii RHA1]